MAAQDSGYYALQDLIIKNEKEKETKIEVDMIGCKAGREIVTIAHGKRACQKETCQVGCKGGPFV